MSWTSRHTRHAATSWANPHPTPTAHTAPGQLTPETDPTYPGVEIRRDTTDPTLWHITDHNYQPPATWTRPTLARASAYATDHNRAPECAHGHMTYQRRPFGVDTWTCPRRRCRTHHRRDDT